VARWTQNATWAGDHSGKIPEVAEDEKGNRSDLARIVLNRGSTAIRSRFTPPTPSRPLDINTPMTGIPHEQQFFFL